MNHTPTTRRATLLALGLAGLLASGCTQNPTPPSATTQDEAPVATSAAACCKIWGETRDPDIVRLSFGRNAEGGWDGVVAYGDGTVITNGQRAHRLDPRIVADLLEVVEESGFREFKDMYGQGPKRVRASVDLMVGDHQKRVVRLLHGIDPEPVTPLIDELMARLRPVLGQGVGAANLEEALRLVADGGLSHRALRLTVFHHPTQTEESSGWILRVHDGWIEVDQPEESRPERRQRVHRGGTEQTIRDVAATLVEIEAWNLPVNIYSPQHTQLAFEALGHRHTVQAQVFARRDSQAQAAERERLQRLLGELEALVADLG